MGPTQISKSLLFLRFIKRLLELSNVVFDSEQNFSLSLAYSTYFSVITTSLMPRSFLLVFDEKSLN